MLRKMSISLIIASLRWNYPKRKALLTFSESGSKGL